MTPAFSQPPIDWGQLAAATGVSAGGGVSSAHGLRALELLVGEENCRAAVDEYVSGTPTAELARSVLSIVRPHCAMAHCVKIALHEPSDQKRGLALELLRVFGDHRVWPHVGKLLTDPSSVVRYWAIALIGELLGRGEISEQEALPLLQVASKDHDAKARAAVAAVAARHIGREASARAGLPAVPDE